MPELVKLLYGGWVDPLLVTDIRPAPPRGAEPILDLPQRPANVQVSGVHRRDFGGITTAFYHCLEFDTYDEALAYADDLGELVNAARRAEAERMAGGNK